MIAKLIQPNKYLPTLMQLMTPLGIWYAYQLHVSSWWWALTLLMFLGYRMIGHGVGLHRYYCHAQFTVGKVSEVVLGWFALMSCVGSPASYTMVHLVHHRYCDTELDPHGPRNGLRSILYCFWHPPYNLEKTPMFGRRLTQLLPYMWIHNWYLILIIINSILLYMIDIKLFIFMWWLPASFTIWELVFSVYISHIRHGKIEPVNHSNIAGWLLPFHEYLHKTHHNYPMLSNLATNKYEFDYTHQLSRIFAKTWKQKQLKD